jgi:geranylgeranyl diphosphate synthase, type II
MTPDAVSILKTHADTMTRYLHTYIDTYAHAPSSLLKAMDYSLSAGGKRLRPALLLESFALAHVFTASSHPQTVLPPADPVPVAAAMEMVHTFSLVHDDLPAMDDDDLRRGRPTNHKVFGEAMAILAGDAMVSLAFEIIAERAPADLVAVLVRELARATGPCGMIGGQVLDIAGENQILDLQQLQQIHQKKTGALLVASCRLGALCARAPADVVNTLGIYGQHIGLGFQIMDDVLDETATPQQMGKATGKDAGRGKNTYPQLMGLQASQAEAQQQITQAIHALAPFGPAADNLNSIARFITDRRV